MGKITEYSTMLLLKVLNLKGTAAQYAKKSKSFKTFQYLDPKDNEILERSKKIMEKFKKEKDPLYFNFYDPDPNVAYILHTFKKWFIIWYTKKRNHIKDLLTKKKRYTSRKIKKRQQQKNIKIMAAKKYVLIDVKAPILKGKEILKDPDVGGLKLVYEVSNEKTTLSKKDNKCIVYLKPYKENWGADKKDVKKGEWGNSSSPLSNVWLEIKKDYTSYEKENMSIRGDVVKDSNLIAQLNKQTKEFIIGIDEDIRNIPFKLKIIFKFEQVLEVIKSRIFLR